MGIGKIIKAQDFSQNFAPISHNQDAATINTGIFSINRIPALPYLSSTGKAADSELLDGLNSTAFSLVNHNHDWSSLNTVSIPAFASRWPDWSEVTNKPTTFIPSSHDHDAASITSGVFDSARIPVLPYLSSTGKATDSELLDGLDSTAFVLATDSRLVNSREWVAATVSQAEAEAGTGTFRRAFTPQRVFQANASYINQFGVKTVAGRIGDIVLSKADVGLSNVQNIDATDASNIVTGTLNVSRLSTNVALRSSTQTFSGINTFTEKVNFTNPTVSIEASGLVLANSFTGNGAGLTNLSAGNLTGTIADARLSSNILKLNTASQATSATTSITTTGQEFALIDSSSGYNFTNYFWARPSTNQLYIGSNILTPTFRSKIVVNDTTNATSSASDASIHTDGGIACAGDIYATKVAYTQDDVVSFTPTLSGSGWGFSIQYGQYIRQGRRVDFVIQIATTTVGTFSGGLSVVGLPFGAINFTFFGGCRANGLTGLPSSYYFCPYVRTIGDIQIQYQSGSPIATTTLTTANFTTSTNIYLAGSYITAS